MANYALIETRGDGKECVTQICSVDPKTRFHPDIAKLFVSVTASVKEGQIKSGSKWVDDPELAAKAYVSKIAIGPDGSVGNKCSRDWQSISKANFILHVSRDARIKYRKAVADGNVDIVNALEDYWINTDGGEIWFKDTDKNPEWKNSIADLKTAGILTDADVTALSNFLFLDQTAINE